MTEKLLVPDIGDFENVEVIELLVAEGQEVKINDPVVTIESDKSSVEIPSTFSGKVENIEVKVGDKVSKGDLLLNISSPSKKLSKLEFETSKDASQENSKIIQKTPLRMPIAIGAMERQKFDRDFLSAQTCNK